MAACVISLTEPIPAELRILYSVHTATLHFNIWPPGRRVAGLRMHPSAHFSIYSVDESSRTCSVLFTLPALHGVEMYLRRYPIEPYVRLPLPKTASFVGRNDTEIVRCWTFPFCAWSLPKLPTPANSSKHILLLSPIRKYMPPPVTECEKVK